MVKVLDFVQYRNTLRRRLLCAALVIPGDRTPAQGLLFRVPRRHPGRLPPTGHHQHGWVCFHCGERFTTPGSAAFHFGARPEATVACLIKYGQERGLVMALRKAEAEIEQLREVLNEQ